MQPAFTLGQSHYDPSQWILSDARGATIAVVTSEEWARRILAALTQASATATPPARRVK